MEEDGFINLQLKAEVDTEKRVSSWAISWSKVHSKRTIHHKETNTVNEQRLATEYS